jgi:methionine aminotransferase
MLRYPSNLSTKLPGTGTSIFAVMSQLAAEHKAINLSQGFPDFEVSGQLIERINHYMKKGYNQYAPMPGVPQLRRAISRKVKDLYGLEYDPDKEITITAGATQALYTAISAIIREGEEAIVFEPAYDSYAPAVKMNGGMVKYSQLSIPGYRIDWEATTRLVNYSTRMILINSPHNPTGSILSEGDLLKLQDFAESHNMVVLSDEVYEHLIYDENIHQSVCRYPRLASRSFVVGSFGKTFHATGWKMGYVLAPEKLTEEFRKVHQYMVFTCNTPIQHALAEFLEDKKNYAGLGKFYQKKRDFLVKQLFPSRFRIIPSYGTYFQLVDYSEITDEPEMEFAFRLTKDYGIATIPLSPFYHRGFNNSTLRLCFAKKEETLEKAGSILCMI